MQQQFNADINVIGSIPDFRLIETALAELAKGQGRVDLKELLVTNNAFDFRTESTRKRFLAAVERTILVFASERHRQLVVALFNAPGTGSSETVGNFFAVACREQSLSASYQRGLSQGLLLRTDNNCRG